VARKASGGGHKQAAGFAHPGTVDEIRGFILAEISAQLAEPAA
jgi:nanoRNase/pAp phosphatase (c-di-AMP/oligoRNAs hydrolase)